MAGYQLGEEALGQIDRGLRKINGMPTPRPGSTRRMARGAGTDGVSFFNDSGETIPANAVMRVTGPTAVDETGQYYSVAKPNSTYTPLYLVNRALPIPYGMGDDSFGIGDWLMDPHASGRVLVDNSVSTPAYGETWGPETGSWKLKKGNNGFKIVGGSGTTEAGNAYCWVYQSPPVSQNYVEYDLKTSLNGFDTVTYGNPALDSTHTSGWTGSTNRAGSESDVGIEYQTSETAPQTNGLYKATKDGLFRITIDGQIKYKFVGTRTPQNMTNVTTGPASSGTAHTHSVVPVGYEGYVAATGPTVWIELWNKKASGGANAIHANALSYFYRWFMMLPPLLSGERWVQVHAQWNVCLSENDKVALKWRYTGVDLTNHAVLCYDGDPPLMRFEYIGPKADWAAM
jgi:hypothetical protein